ILLEIGKRAINATLLRSGRIVESHQGDIQDNDVVQSVDKLLAFFEDVEILPSRILIADGVDNPHLAQKFIKHKWSKTLPFLHVPQVTQLPERFDIRAILHGTATQMGFEVIDVPSAKDEHIFEHIELTQPVRAHDDKRE